MRVALVGAGEQSTESILPGINLIEEIDLIAVCDLNRERAKRSARSFGAGAVYDDVTTMLADEAPDAVIVVGPPQIHEDIGLEVLAAGSHLFVEKPSSPTTSGAKRLFDAQTRSGKFGQVGHMMRHAAPVRIAWELSHQAAFGRILSVETRYTTWPTPAFAAGAGWGEPDEDWSYMLNQGGHPIDLMRHFLGPITRVSAFRSHGRGAAKVYQVIVESTDGAVGFLNLQDSFDGWTTGLEIVGDGHATISVDDLGRVTHRTGEKRTEAENLAFGTSAYVWESHLGLPHGVRTGWGSQLQSFARCILERREPKPSLWDGWQNLVVAEAILESCTTRQVIEIPPQQRHSLKTDA